MKTAPRPHMEGSEIPEHDARVDGYRVRYLRAGTGPPLVLVHGLMGYSFSWRFNIPALARHFTVYALDLLGMGFSERPEGVDHGLRASSRRILDFVEQIGVDSLHLLGTSHGGGVACAMAGVAVERGRPKIEKLILVDAINPWSRIGRKRVALLSNALGAFAFRHAFPYLRHTHGFFVRRMYGNPSLVTKAALQGYAAGLAQPRSADYGIGVVRSWHKDLRWLKELYPRLRGIPTLLLWGERDLAVSPESARELQRALPGSELTVLPGIGHMPYEECPEQFNRIVLDFLLRPVS